jgi:DNA invertase Pin-like site-specific DNA recombinase
MVVVLHFLALAKGKKLGRPHVCVDRNKILALRRDGFSWRAIAEKLEVSVGTAHAAVR